MFYIVSREGDEVFENLNYIFFVCVLYRHFTKLGLHFIEALLRNKRKDENLLSHNLITVL